LLYVPVAVNCCVLPAATEAVEGVTEIEVRTAAVTVNVTELLIAPDVAVIVLVPEEKVLANPPLLTVAMLLADEDHCTMLVRFCVLPSL
jgi:hypothetical protein